jgi:proteasome accessory factor A
MKKTIKPATQMSDVSRVCGADIELGNFIEGAELAGGSGFEASRALLAEIDGQPETQSSYLGYWSSGYAASPSKPVNSFGPAGKGSSQWGYDPLDAGRKFLSENGGCCYLDHAHFELNLPEVTSAFDHAAAWQAMLRIARRALDSANEGRPADRKIKALINNSDGRGNAGESYGSHLNFMISRRAFDNIIGLKKPHHLQSLASFQVSSILLTGIGKVGSENFHAPAAYNISARADHFERLHGLPTTFSRPIVNTRDEPLCGRRGLNDPEAPARLHVIFFDSALAPGSALFRVGLMRIFLAQLERGLVNPRLLLEDPLAAVHAYSADPTLKARAELINGERLTLLELQSAFLEDAKRHAAQGVFDGIVPEAGRILALWEDTLVKFERSDWDGVARRGIDWVLKLTAIERAMDEHPELDWNSPGVKVLDHLYGSLGDDGLYWAYEASGFVEPLVAPERVAFFENNPPAETRAFARAHLLRRAAEQSVTVTAVDWDSITFKMRGRHSWPIYRTLEMADPLGFTEALAGPIFDSAEDFADLLDGLEALSQHDIPTQRSLTLIKN